MRSMRPGRFGIVPPPNPRQAEGGGRPQSEAYRENVPDGHAFVQRIGAPESLFNEKAKTGRARLRAPSPRRQ